MTEAPIHPPAKPTLRMIRQECLRQLTISAMAMLILWMVAALGDTFRLILIPLSLWILFRSINRLMHGLTMLRQARPVQVGMARVSSAVGWGFGGLFLWAFAAGEGWLPPLTFGFTEIIGALGVVALAFIVWEIIGSREVEPAGGEPQA